MEEVFLEHQLWLFLVLVPLLLLLLIYSTTKTKLVSTCKRAEAPEPTGGLWLIGHLHLLRRRKLPLHETLASMSDKHGPAMTLHFGLRKTLVISSSDLARECFTINDLAFSSRPRDSVSEYLGYGGRMLGFAPYGEYWRRMRKIATIKLLCAHRVNDVLRHMRVAEVDAVCKDLFKKYSISTDIHDDGGRKVMIADMKKMMGDMTFNMLGWAVAGKRFSAERDSGDAVAEKFQALMRRWTLLMIMGSVSDDFQFPFLKWMELDGRIVAMKSVAGEIGDVVGSWIEEHRQKTKRGVLMAADFIDELLEEFVEEEEDPKTIIKANTLAMILGGSDTTVMTLLSTIYMLVSNPQVLKKVQNELDIHVGKNRNVEETDIKNLVYLQAIIKETLRMHPTFPILIPREATEDCVVGGFKVRAGTRLIVNAWKIHRDPTVWPEPTEFRPERFLDSQVDVKGQHYEFLPFGSGRRSCPGIAFAMSIVLLTVARLAHSFDMELHQPSYATATGSPMLELLLRLSPRLPTVLYS